MNEDNKNIFTMIGLYIGILFYMFIYNKIKKYGPSSSHIQKLIIVTTFILLYYLYSRKSDILFKIVLLLIYFVMLFLLVRAYYNSKEIEKQAESNISWPPLSYQDNIGSVCPDYWFPNQDKTKCVNKFNIPVNENCGDASHGDFPAGYDKEILISNLSADVQKCNWVTNCGVKNDSNGSWTGVDNKCGIINIQENDL